MEMARPPKSVEQIKHLKRFFFLRRQNPFFLDNYPSLAHPISRTGTIIIPVSEVNFLVIRKISRVSDVNKVAKSKNK